jgi:hypothetical protein
MNKHILPILLIIAVLIFTFAIYTYSNNSDNSLNKTIGPNTNPIKEVPKYNITNTSNNQSIKNNSQSNTKISSNTGSNSVSSNQQTNNNNNQDNPTNQLPPDVNSLPCGYYYGSYGVCNGTCSEGTCVSEERSCYCKK